VDGICSPCHWKARAAADASREAALHDAHPTLRAKPPTHCRRCGRRLWADEEKADGICVPCSWQAHTAPPTVSKTPHALLAGTGRSRAPSSVGWEGHTKRGKAVIVVLWILAALSTVGAVAMVGVVVRFGPGAIQPVTVGTFVLAGALAVLNVSAAVAFTRFILWAWWYVVIVLGLFTLLGLLGSVGAGAPGLLVPSLILLAALVGTVSIRVRLRKSRR
jgi:hypothetical protein